MDRMQDLLEIIIYFVAIVFAADALLKAWFYGSIFEKWRKYFENKPGLLGDLLSCPFCLSYHVIFWLFSLTYIPHLFISKPWDMICLMPVIILAAISSFHKLWNIYPEEDEEETEDESNDESGSQNPS